MPYNSRYGYYNTAAWDAVKDVIIPAEYSPSQWYRMNAPTAKVSTIKHTGETTIPARHTGETTIPARHTGETTIPVKGYSGETTIPGWRMEDLSSGEIARDWYQIANQSKPQSSYPSSYGARTLRTSPVNTEVFPF